MLKAKLALLYALLLVVVLTGVYAAFQCLPQEVEEPEEPYEFETLDPFVETPATPDSTEEDITPQYDFDGLLAENDDFVGWLSIADTPVSFPVVLGDDNDFYLKHGFSKGYSAYGCPFLDTRTPLDGDNLVIHGHNMGYNREEIFSTLVYLQEEEYASAHKTIHFARPDREGEEYELFAVANVDVNDESMNYIRSTFETEEERTEFLSSLQKISLYPSDEIPEGQILILSTCNRVYGENNRLLIVAVECGKFS